MEKYKISILSVTVFILSFIFCRFIFFETHGIKSWPTALFIMGVMISGVSLIFKWKLLPLFASFGYPISFGIGLIFQNDYADPSGKMTMNNMWIIWTATYLFSIILGIVIEVRTLMDRNLKNFSFYTILVIVFYGIPWFICDTGSAMFIMLLIIPAICFVTSLMYGVKNGFHFYYVLITAAIFTPSIFIFYNSTAWIYIILYSIVAMIGNLAALPFKNR